MQSELLVTELAALIRRLEHRITQTPGYASVLQQDTADQAVQHTLAGIEDAICGLVMLHIQTRRSRP